MVLERGITVAEAIEQLQKCDPQAILVGAGEYGFFPFKRIAAGILSRYAREEPYLTGLCFYPEGEEAKGRQQQPAVHFD